MISKESILLPSKDVENKQVDRMPTEIDLVWDKTSTEAKVSFTKIIAKTLPRAKNFKKYHSDLLQ